MANLASEIAVQAEREIPRRYRGRLHIAVAPDLTIDEFVAVTVKCAGVLYENDAKPMEIMIAFQRAMATQAESEGASPSAAVGEFPANPADEAQPGPEEWQPGEGAA